MSKHNNSFKRALRNFVATILQNPFKKYNDSDEKYWTKLSTITERPINELKALQYHFSLYSTHGELDQTQFYKLYTTLRHEDAKQLEQITKYIFKAFDKNKNGRIDFKEFAVNVYKF